MSLYFKATFSDGTVIRRITSSRKYTHAWVLRVANKEPEKWGPTSQWQGFCGTEKNAASAALRRTRTLARYRNMRDVLFAEVAPTVELTSKEYRQLIGA